MGCGTGASAPAAIGESGGTQPPFTQTHVAAGFMVVQLLGTVTTGTTGAAGTTGTVGAGAAGATALIANGWPGGSHPPFTQTHPDPGEALTHDEALGTGVGCTGDAGGGVTVAPVTNV